jgi:uncharacterized protein YoxC
MVIKIDGVKGKTEDLLTKTDIATVQDVFELKNAYIQHIVKSVQSLGVVGLSTIIDTSRNATNESTPETEYNIRVENKVRHTKRQVRS